MRVFAFVWIGVACTQTDPEVDSGTPVPGEVDAASAAWVDRLVGTWVGQAETPMGGMLFAMMGEPTDAGVRTSIEQMGLRFVLDFVPTPEGARLTERGELPGGFVQEHDLLLVERDGDTTRWASVEPGLMDMETTVSDDVWSLSVDVRGVEHCSWTLNRQ